ncbi:MAG: hypothetical protein ACK4NQ_00030 [Fimbriimonadaceae bacterium]
MIVFAVGQAITVIGWLIALGNRVSRLEASSKSDTQTTKEILNEVKALRGEVHRGAVENAALKATVDALIREIRETNK